MESWIGIGSDVLNLCAHMKKVFPYVYACCMSWLESIRVESQIARSSYSAWADMTELIAIAWNFELCWIFHACLSRALVIKLLGT